MTDLMRTILERLPENTDVIRELRETNSAFDSLWDEYVIISEELDALRRVTGASAAARVHALRQRRTDLEEELLTMIEGYQPA